MIVKLIDHQSSLIVPIPPIKWIIHYSSPIVPTPLIKLIVHQFSPIVLFRIRYNFIHFQHELVEYNLRIYLQFGFLEFELIIRLYLIRNSLKIPFPLLFGLFRLVNLYHVSYNPRSNFVSDRYDLITYHSNQSCF